MTRGGAIARASLVAGVAFVAYVGYGIYAAGFDERPPPPASTDITFKNGTAMGHRVVSRSWSADYQRIQSNADQSMLELDGVENGIVYKHGKPYLHVRAQHMSVNTISHDFSAVGPVHVETVGVAPARRFETTSAVWEDALGRLTLSKHVTIFTGSEAPLSIGRMTFDVKSGAIDIDGISGPVRFK